MKSTKKNLIALTISIIFVLLVFHNVDFKTLLSTFKNINYKILLWLIPLETIKAYFRGLRWKYLIPKCKLDAIEISEIYGIGSALNVFLPARGGDLYRACKVAIRNNESKSKILGSVVLERILDGFTVILILLIAISLYQNTSQTSKILFTAIIFFGTSLATVIVLLKNTERIQNITNRLITLFASKKLKFLESICTTITNYTTKFITGFETLKNPKELVAATLLCIVIWGIESIIGYIYIAAFSLGLPFTTALFVLSFSALSSIIPSSSIFIGPYQYAYILAMGLFGINKSNALAIAFTQQSVTVIIITTLALIFYAKQNTKFNNNY